METLPEVSGVDVRQEIAKVAIGITRDALEHSQLEVPDTNDHDPLLWRLNKREREVLELTARGLTYKEIALRRSITVDTVRAYLTSACEKLGVGSFIEATAFIKPPEDEEQKKEAAELVSKLTPREVEVAELIMQGLSQAEIAETLGMSFQTAKVHVRHVREKLLVGNRMGIAYKMRAAASYSPEGNYVMHPKTRKVYGKLALASAQLAADMLD